MSKQTNPYRAARLHRGLTQAEAGERLGCTKQNLSQYETGKNKPGEDMIRELARVYGVEFRISGDGVTWVDEQAGMFEAVALALRELHDLQNDAPLERDRARWEAAMTRAGEVLERVGY